MTFSQITNGKNWSTPSPLPKISDNNWNVVQLLGLIFLVMAVLQLISFSSFKDTLSGFGLSGPGTWAAVLIIAELWAAVSFAKVRLAPAFRLVGNTLAILTAGFWLVENFFQLTNGYLGSSNFFGKYLTQTPGWWTAIEVTVLMLWTLNAVHLTKNSN